MRRADWANVPTTGLISGVMIPGGTGSVLVERGTGCLIVDQARKPITRQQKIIFRSAVRYNTAAFRLHIHRYETPVPYMYLDDRGNVTVGLGHLIPDINAAKQLLFHDRKTKLGSAKTHIGNAYNLVKNSGLAGDDHRVFKNLTHIDLDFGAIDVLFNSDVSAFLANLKTPVPQFETYPATAQLGILDLVYNFGVAGFVREYPILIGALRFRNWIEVADESGREALNAQGNIVPDIIKRNQDVRDWFLRAIKDEPFFLNPKCPPKQLSQMP